jgi:pilus assembly protein CpaD
MMTPRKRPRFALQALAGLALLAACTPRTEEWSPAESPKRNVVSWVEYHHSMAFPAGSATFSPEQRAGLDDFLDRVAEGEGVRIAIAGGPGGDDALALRRETAIAGYLRGRGYRPQLGTAPAGAPASTPSGAVTISVGRYIVTPPSCPDWSKPPGLDSANRVASNLGCATEANLGLMVADPGNLVRGYSLAPGDGDTLAKGIQNYRKNEWKTSHEEPWLPVTTTSSPQ